MTDQTGDMWRCTSHTSAKTRGRTTIKGEALRAGGGWRTVAEEIRQEENTIGDIDLDVAVEVEQDHIRRSFLQTAIAWKDNRASAEKIAQHADCV